MLGTNITFEGVKGVGTIALELQPDQRVYTFIGVNGIGKTKMLEALFQYLLISYSHIAYYHWQHISNFIVFNSIKINNNYIEDIVRTKSIHPEMIPKHSLPILFLASQNRGFIQHSTKAAQAIGTLEQRRTAYFSRLLNGMASNFTSLNMEVGIEQWFVTLAQSANPYQKQEDNRDIEIRVVLQLLHQLDQRIDPHYLQITGDGRVQVKIDGQARELSHLSTGFASILKMLQAIVSGYGYFTNETRLQHVKGVVLIDEIESHLHLAWQAKIIPLLKQLFPNTTFYITTHSSIVLSQLKAGEAYRLQRDPDGVVRTQAITAPNTASLIDVLQEAFDLNLNQLKLDNVLPADQQAAKQQLLNLLKNNGDNGNA